jgi:hypothetical protein
LYFGYLVAVVVYWLNGMLGFAMIFRGQYDIFVYGGLGLVGNDPWVGQLSLGLGLVGLVVLGFGNWHKLGLGRRIFWEVPKPKGVVFMGVVVALRLLLVQPPEKVYKILLEILID